MRSSTQPKKRLKKIIYNRITQNVKKQEKNIMQEHILLVDDDLSILDGFEEILTKNHYSVIKARDRHEALNHIAKRPCKAAVVDLVLKESSGLDLITALKDISQDMAIIVLTGYPSVDSAKESFKRGAFEYLEKPCGKDNLLKTLQQAINHKKSEQELASLKKQKDLLDNLLFLDQEDLGARVRSVYSQMDILIQGSQKFSNHPSQEAKDEYINLIKVIALMAQNTLKKFVFNGLKVLIIDNDLLTLSSLNHQLSALGCTVSLSNNAEEAKTLLGSGRPFDVCIMEKNMSGLNGTELTAFIRKEVSPRMPIIGISEFTNAEDKDLCLASGMNAALEKPVNISKLKNRMIHLLFQNFNIASQQPETKQE